MVGIVTTGLLERMLSEQELGAYFLALSIVSLGAIVGSLGLPKTVVGLVAENMGVGRSDSRDSAVSSSSGTRCAIVKMIVTLLRSSSFQSSASRRRYSTSSSSAKLEEEQ